MRLLFRTVLPGLAVLVCGWAMFQLIERAAEDRPSPAAADVRDDARRGATSATAPTTRRPLAAAADTVARSGDFDEAVDELVALGLVIVGELANGPGGEAARDANGAAEEKLAELHRRFADAPELALDRLTRLPDEDADDSARVRRGVLERVVRDGLADRWQRHRRGGPRRVLDELVSAMLACLPASEPLARGLAPLLEDRPYLGEAHEPAVLSVAETSRELEFLRPIAAGLLRTLWRNLRSTGARTESEISAFALLLQDDLNPSRRLAAMEELLTAGGGRYRDFVVDRVVESGDARIARELGAVAATELDVEDALDVLGDLHEVAGEGLIGSFLTVGQRDSAALGACYEQHLADAVRPELRAELVSGALATDAPGALALATTAFEHDPDPRVRRRALYALAAHPDPVAAERALNAALADPRTSNDPAWIADVAASLRNLAGRAGTSDALARLGRVLVDHPLLADADRRRVAELLREHLPRGRLPR